MKKKLFIILIGILFLISLFTIPTNYSENVPLNSDNELAFNPPCKLPKLPPEE